MFTNQNINEAPIFVGKRKQLVLEIQRKGIESKRVLAAIGSVPRQEFFPADFVQFAYRDAAFPIGFEQTISQPYTVAYQTQLCAIQPSDKVLEIGTGSGYQAAVLSKLANEIYSIEIIKELQKNAAKVLKKLDTNVKLYSGDGTLGLPNLAPFDVILVTAAAPDVPKTYIEQLAIGGRLVIPVGDNKELQTMMRITKLTNNTTQTEIFESFVFVPLIGKNGWKLDK